MTQIQMIDPTPAPASSSPRHFAFVDSLRGLAILGVVTCHTCTYANDFHGRFRIYFYKGSFGVQLFFLVSAFTLFGSLASRTKVDRKPIHAFFVRRIFRILPLFWAGTFFYLWSPDAWRAVEAPAGVHLRQIVTTLLLVHGWSATTINSIVPGGWSIAAEAMFYLCIPFLFSKIKTLSASMWLTVIAMALVGLIMPFAITESEAHYPRAWILEADSFIERSFPAQFPVFCMGFVLYFLTRRERDKPGGSGDSATAWFFVALSLCLFFTDLPAYINAALAFLSLAYGLAIYPLDLLVNRFTRYLGMISYSIYIWHFVILDHLSHFIQKGSLLHKFYAVNTGFVGFCFLFLSVLVVCIPVATISYYLIELPGQLLGKWLLRQMAWDASAKKSEQLAPVLVPLGGSHS